MARSWNDEQRIEQSRRTTLLEPWRFSCGPKKELSKQKVSRNALKNGYYSKSFRETRKVRRSSAARQIESLIRALGKEKDDDKFLELVDQILNELDDYSDAMSPQETIEATYLNSLTLTVVNNSIFSRISKMISDFPEYSDKLKTA
jgi:hypothetical protein